MLPNTVLPRPDPNAIFHPALRLWQSDSGINRWIALAAIILAGWTTSFLWCQTPAIHSVIVTETNTLTPNQVRTLQAVVQLPLQLPDYQEISFMSLSPIPEDIFRQRDHFYCVYLLQKPADSPVILTAKTSLNLRNRDLNTLLAAGANPSLRLDNPAPWLKAETYIESDHPQLIAAAAALKKKDRIDTLRAIFLFIINHMTYSGFSSDDKGALRGFQDRSGDCSEYSDLFTALCRANQIPCRTAEGYTIEYNTTPRHSWCEAFIDDYGWVRFDPTVGDQGVEGLNEFLFDHLQNIYVTTSVIRNDPLLENKHSLLIRNWSGSIQIQSDVKFEKLN